MWVKLGEPDPALMTIPVVQTEAPSRQESLSTNAVKTEKPIDPFDYY